MYYATLYNYTCGRQSGLDSNITKSTPIGTLHWTSSRFSITFTFFMTLPIISFSLTVFANCFKPVKRQYNYELIDIPTYLSFPSPDIKLSILLSVIRSLPFNDWLKPADSFMSFLLKYVICSR